MEDIHNYYYSYFIPPCVRIFPYSFSCSVCTHVVPNWLAPSILPPPLCHTHFSSPSPLLVVELVRGNMSVVQMMAFAGEVVVMDCPTEVLDAVSIPFETRANLSCSNRTLILRRAVSTFDTARYNCEIQTPSGRRYQSTVFLTVNGMSWICSWSSHVVVVRVGF